MDVSAFLDEASSPTAGSKGWVAAVGFSAGASLPFGVAAGAGLAGGAAGGAADPCPDFDDSLCFASLANAGALICEAFESPAQLLAVPEEAPVEETAAAETCVLRPRVAEPSSVFDGGTSAGGGGTDTRDVGASDFCAPAPEADAPALGAGADFAADLAAAGALFALPLSSLHEDVAGADSGELWVPAVRGVSLTAFSAVGGHAAFLAGLGAGATAGSVCTEGALAAEGAAAASAGAAVTGAAHEEVGDCGAALWTTDTVACGSAVGAASAFGAGVTCSPPEEATEGEVTRSSPDFFLSVLVTLLRLLCSRSTRCHTMFSSSAAEDAGNSVRASAFLRAVVAVLRATPGLATAGVAGGPVLLPTAPPPLSVRGNSPLAAAVVAPTLAALGGGPLATDLAGLLSDTESGGSGGRSVSFFLSLSGCRPFRCLPFRGVAMPVLIRSCFALTLGRSSCKASSSSNCCCKRVLREE